MKTKRAGRINALFEGELQCITMGLDVFAENLQRQGVIIVQIAWRPPAAGDERLIGLLRRLGR